jgi:acyl carrier protein
MREQIIAILSELRPEFDFTENVNFIEEGMLDSFDIVTLVTELEGKFDVTIDGEQVLPENFSSVESIETLVNNSEKNA